MIAITKSPTKDKIDKYILALIIVQYIEDIKVHYLSLENLGILYRELNNFKLQQVMPFHLFCQKHQLKYIHLSLVS